MKQEMHYRSLVSGSAYPIIRASTSPLALPHADDEIRFVSGSPEPDVSCVLVATA